MKIRERLFKEIYATKEVRFEFNLTEEDKDKILSLVGKNGIEYIEFIEGKETDYIVIGMKKISYNIDIPIRINNNHYIVRANFTHLQDVLFVIPLDGIYSNAIVISPDRPSFNRLTKRTSIIHPNIDYFSHVESFDDAVDQYELTDIEVDIITEYFGDYYLEDLYFSRFCMGTLKENSYLIKYIDLYIKQFLHALFYPNFESPYVSIDSYRIAFSNPDLPNDVEEEIDYDISNIHNYDEKCKCPACITLSYASGKIKCAYTSYFLVNPPMELETDYPSITLKGIEINKGFNINNFSAFSRFNNMVNIQNLSVRNALIIGLGNLGSRIAIDVRRLPIFDISVMDYDKVTQENIFTQQYTTKNIDMSKAVSIADELFLIKPLDRDITYCKNIFSKFYFDYKKPIPKDYKTEQLMPMSRYKFFSYKPFNRNLIIVAVDSQEARKHIINFYEHFAPPTYEYEDEYLRPLFIDVSMSPNFVRVFSFYLDNREAVKRYKVLLDKKVTEEGVCGQTSHNWMGTLVSYVVQKILIDEANGKDIPFYTHIIPDLGKVSYDVKDDFFPRYLVHLREYLDINDLNPFNVLYSLDCYAHKILKNSVNGSPSRARHTLNYIPFDLGHESILQYLERRCRYAIFRGNSENFQPLFTLCEKLKEGIATSPYCENECPFSRFRFLCKDRDRCLISDMNGTIDFISRHNLRYWLGRVNVSEYDSRFIDLISDHIHSHLLPTRLDSFFVVGNDHYKFYNEYFKHLNREEYENDNFY